MKKIEDKKKSEYIALQGEFKRYRLKHICI